MVRLLAGDGLRVVGLKPLASGSERSGPGHSLRNTDALELQAASSIRLPYERVNPVCFEPALAPHQAAGEAGSDYSGVLCGRATWKDGIPVYGKQGARALEDWLQKEGIRRIVAVNDAIRSATPWFEKMGLGAPA